MFNYIKNWYNQYKKKRKERSYWEYMAYMHGLRDNSNKGQKHSLPVFNDRHNKWL